MKSIPKILFIVILFTSFLYAEILHVPSEKYPTIQAGIDSALIGDTVLVVENTYYENISFEGKAITVASQFFMDNDKSHISNTIIDGSQPLERGIGSVVSFTSGEDSTTVLCGFTLTGGRGSGGSRSSPSCGGGIYCENNSNPVLRDLIITGNWGGTGGGIYCANNSNPLLSDILVTENQSFTGAGIFCGNSNPTIIDVTVRNNIAPQHPQGGSDGGGFFIGSSNPTLINVIVEGNQASNGGGIYCSNSNISLSNTAIKKNIAFSGTGGGIYFKNSTINFNPVDRSNIFLNFANNGGDIFSEGSTTTNIVVDTFTVLNPDNLHATPINNFTFDILNAKVVQVNSDLYVNPTGNDDDSGLSPSEPLRTISYAINKIIPDSTNPRKIFLANGIYSPSNSGENFPLFMRSHVSLIGESEKDVIIDAEGQLEQVIGLNQDKGIELENITITGCVNRGISCSDNSDLIISHVTLKDNKGEGIYYSYHSDVTLLNVTIFNTDGPAIVSDNYSFCSGANITIYNSTICGNKVNCRFNSRGGIVRIVNSIFWNNTETEIEYWGSWMVNIAHSNIYMAPFQNDEIYWIGDNKREDPMFVDEFTGDFRLLEGSPCIDSGVQDTILAYNNDYYHLPVPAMDYMGSAPDIGAFESDPDNPLTNIEKQLNLPQSYNLKQNYPNPFNPSTTIEFSLPKAENVVIEVYNTLGQKIKTLLNKPMLAGPHEIEFNDQNLSSGIYFYRIEAGEFQEVKKMILIK